MLRACPRGEDVEVKERVEQAFRSLLEKEPYKKITVAEICEEAGIARKTFYAHFENKEDVVSYIFRRGVTEPEYEMHRLLPRDYAEENSCLFHTRLYELIKEDGDFYYKLVGPLRGVDDTFIRVATWAIYDLNIKILSEGNYFRADDWEMDYTAYFFGSSQAMLVQKWISDGMKVPPEKLGDLYKRLALAFWKDGAVSF